jgi:hypothetical protein
MHKNATKCNKTQRKWCINKHGASKIIDMFETYHPPCTARLATAPLRRAVFALCGNRGIVGEHRSQCTTQVPLYWHRARPGNVKDHIECDRSCHRACAPLFDCTQVIGGSVARARLGATVCVLDQGVSAPVAWPSPQRKRIRTHWAAAGPRHCRPVCHSFPTAKTVHKPTWGMKTKATDVRATYS